MRLIAMPGFSRVKLWSPVFAWETGELTIRLWKSLFGGRLWLPREVFVRSAETNTSGSPLVVAPDDDGYLLGSLCVVDFIPTSDAGWLKSWEASHSQPVGSRLFTIRLALGNRVFPIS